MLEARPALLRGDESGANFHSSPSGNGNSSKERLPNVRKPCCIETGEEICPRRENEKRNGGKDLVNPGILRFAHAHKYAAVSFPA